MPATSAESAAPVATAAPVTLQGIELSTRYPSMTVKAEDDLTFDPDPENGSGSSKDPALSIASIPEGRKGSFSAGNRPVTTVHVKNEEIVSDVDFVPDIPPDTPDGDYTIDLSAMDGTEGDTMTPVLRVSAEEMGESSPEVEYPSQEGDATTAFSFSADLINNTLSDQSYAFSANAPSGRTVSFLPAGETTKVAAPDVAAGTTQGVTISVTPPSEIEAVSTLPAPNVRAPGITAQAAYSGAVAGYLSFDQSLLLIRPTSCP